MTVLEEVFAGNSLDSFVITYDFEHPAFDDGSEAGHLSLAQSNVDILGGIENGGGNRTFRASGAQSLEPVRDSNGSGSLQISISNINNIVYDQFNKLRYYNNESSNGQVETKVTLRYYLASNASTPAKPPLLMYVNNISLTRSTALVTATYRPLYDTYFPRLKYYPQNYNGLKYL
tara:strand:- start:1281 stop:1805 length:525 start_codon:yes stop_codon:yes gene_type:complete